MSIKPAKIQERDINNKEKEKDSYLTLCVGVTDRLQSTQSIGQDKIGILQECREQLLKIWDRQAVRHW